MFAGDLLSMSRPNMIVAASSADGYYGSGCGVGVSGGGSHHSGGAGGHHNHHHHGHHHHHHNGNGNGHHHHHHHHHAVMGPAVTATALVDAQGAVGGSDVSGTSGVGYRVQRQAANIRERRRMLRSDLAPTRAADRPTPVKM